MDIVNMLLTLVLTLDPTQITSIVYTLNFLKKLLPNHFEFHFIKNESNLELKVTLSGNR